MAAITLSQDTTYNHLVSAYCLPLQRQGEVWHQTLQTQAGNLAQALLQTDQLKKGKKDQSAFKQKDKGAIQQVIVIVLNNISL